MLPSSQRRKTLSNNINSYQFGRNSYRYQSRCGERIRMLADDGYSRERHDNRASRRPLRAKTPHDNVLRRKMGLLRSLDDTNVVLSLERFEFVLLRFDLVCERGHDLCDAVPVRS